MKTKLLLGRNAAVWLLVSILNSQLSTHAQGTAFTYQGRLNDGANPANGHYDFQFVLFSQSQFGNPVGPILINANVSVNNGVFTSALDFGTGIFTGTNYWLDISARTNGDGTFTQLLPRQALAPAPYAIMASSASNLLGVLPSAQLSGLYSGVVTFGNAANTFDGTFIGNGNGLTTLNASQLTSGTVPDARLSAAIARANQVWQIGGNAGTSSDFIGTTDDQPFDVCVNNVRVMRYRLNTDAGGNYTNAPNVVGGSPVNGTGTTGVVGATVAGGGGMLSGTSLPNRATANFCSVGGGSGNTASGFAATVAGGDGNTASGDWATVGGCGFNVASGSYATVPGGVSCAASGFSSFAAGNGAKAGNYGSFVWADSSGFDFHSTTDNQFRVRAVGGATFVTAIDSSGNVTAGVHVLSGDTAWSSISDRNQKKNFAVVHGEAVLEKLVKMPVQAWNYVWESDTNTPHLGPMAQDFKAAFYPGRDDKSISTLEFDGVELAAIQGLNQKLEQKDTELTELKQKNELLEKRLDALEKIIRIRKSN